MQKIIGLWCSKDGPTSQPGIDYGFGCTIYQDIYCDGSSCFLDYQKHAAKQFNRPYRKSYLYIEQKRIDDPRLQK